MKILNLTQHLATPDQIDQGVLDLSPDHRAQVQELLTFEELPSETHILLRADTLVMLANRLCKEAGTNRVMIGGAPWVITPLVNFFKYTRLIPLFAFSKRIVTEESDGQGGTRKVSTFRHEGWIEAL